MRVDDSAFISDSAKRLPALRFAISNDMSSIAYEASSSAAAIANPSPLEKNENIFPRRVSAKSSPISPSLSHTPTVEPHLPRFSLNPASFPKSHSPDTSTKRTGGLKSLPPKESENTSKTAPDMSIRARKISPQISIPLHSAPASALFIYFGRFLLIFLRVRVFSESGFPGIREPHAFTILDSARVAFHFDSEAFATSIDSPYLPSASLQTAPFFSFFTASAQESNLTHSSAARYNVSPTRALHAGLRRSHNSREFNISILPPTAVPSFAAEALKLPSARPKPRSGGFFVNRRLQKFSAALARDFAELPAWSIILKIAGQSVKSRRSKKSGLACCKEGFPGIEIA